MAGITLKKMLGKGKSTTVLLEAVLAASSFWTRRLPMKPVAPVTK